MVQECSVVADCVLWPRLPDVLFMVLRFCLFVHAFAHRERLLSSTNMLPCSPQNLNMDDTVCWVNADLLTVAGTGKGVTAEFIGNGRRVKNMSKIKKYSMNPPTTTHTHLHPQKHTWRVQFHEGTIASCETTRLTEVTLMTLMTSPWAEQ